MGHFRAIGTSIWNCRHRASAPGCEQRAARRRAERPAAPRHAVAVLARAGRGTSAIARNTVVEAYGQLVAEGWLTPAGVRDPGGRARLAAVGPRAVGAGAGRAGPRTTCAPGSPDLSAFPRAAWLAAARRALDAAPPRRSATATRAGGRSCGAALAAYLARARGVARRPGPNRGLHRLHPGARADLRGAARARRRGRGRRGATGSQPPRASSRPRPGSAGALPVDDARRAWSTRSATADAALLTPAHQFPLGVALAPRAPDARGAWAATRRADLEDDYDGEFRYDRSRSARCRRSRRSRGLRRHGEQDAGSRPAAGLAGAARLPRRRGRGGEGHADRHTGALDQLTLAELIGSGEYDRHVRRAG